MNIFKKIAARGKYQDENAIPQLVDYIMNPVKRKTNICGYYHVNPQDIAESMIAVSEKFHKNYGVRLHHYIVSLDKQDPYTPSMLQMLGEDLCIYTAREFQTIFALHEDTEYLHFHIMFNAVSYRDGHKFRGDMASYYQLYNWVATILDHFSDSPVVHVNYYENPYQPHE